MPRDSFCYRYPHPAVTADSIVFRFNGNGLEVLLVKRKGKVFHDYWAIPGGFLNMDETIEACAKRELSEETHIENIKLELFNVYSALERDPRERVITVAFYGLMPPSQNKPIAGDDAAELAWFDLNALPTLAFDHNQIVHDAYEHVKAKAKAAPIIFRLLNRDFTVTTSKRLCEIFDGTSYDQSAFHEAIMTSPFITLAGNDEEGEQQFTFDGKSYRQSPDKAPQRTCPFNL